MSSQRPFVLGDWRVDPAQGLLVRDGKQTRLEPRLMDLLLLFAASPGRVIAKDEIASAVWGGRAIGDDTLAAAVSRLRSALGESKDARFIETLPKRGYRLVISPDLQVRSPTPAEDDVEVLLRKGRTALAVPMPQSLAQARIYFEAAVAAAPRSAPAHAGLAEAMLVQHQVGQGASFAASAKASALAATALDPDLAIGWSLLGMATLLAERDFAGADAALRKALALDANLVAAHRARGFALTATGRFVEAEREARRAVELEPLSVTARVDLIQFLLAARRFTHALSEAKKAFQLGPHLAEAWSGAGWAHAFLGNHRDAVDALLESIRLLGSDAGTIARLREEFARAGFDAFCAAGADLMEQQRVMFVPRPMDMAMLRANAGQSDAAFAALEEAIKRDDPVTLLLPWLPHLDRLRNDPRFGSFLSRARLVH
jgi:DNA-binding winged helix-turn-helix (wHTH) protein/Tfp pilus assembly protein PilF